LIVPEESLSERPGIAQYFGRLAKTYGEGAYYRKRRSAVIATLREEIHGAPRMLDLGCGNGANLFELRDAIRCALIVGADLSRHMLAEADRRQRGGIARVPLLCADAMALPFRTGAWDVIFCSHVLQMVPDVASCVRAIGMSLKPGGLLVVAGGGGRMGGQMFASLNDEQRAILGAGRRGGRAREAVRDLEVIQDTCKAEGFAVERKRLPLTVTGAELAEWYRIRWIPVLDDSMRAAVEQVLEQVMAERGAEQFESAETLLFARKRG
jgi:SAM-dependent methyltransferase